VVSNLTFSFEKETTTETDEDFLEHSEEESTKRLRRRILFRDLSFQLTPGASAIVHGPSGIGKSTLLKILAGLALPDNGTIKLVGKNMSKHENMTSWRRHVLYVPQTKVDIPGTPLDLIMKISSFSVRKNDDDIHGGPSAMKASAVTFLTAWSVSKGLLDSEWKNLSGGESQKVLLAIAMASRPKVILLDESTSAMDHISKVQIEKSVEEYSSKIGMCVIWITHDQAQRDRLLTTVQK